MGEHAAPEVPASWQKYAKFIVALAGAITATAAQIGLTGVPTTWEDWFTIAIYFVTAATVRQVPNKDKKNVV
jgi:hypothetical protein